MDFVTKPGIPECGVLHCTACRGRGEKPYPESFYPCARCEGMTDQYSLESWSNHIGETIVKQSEVKNMAFHYKEGWFFKRREDGSVRIYQQQPVRENIVKELGIDIEADSWASIMASVSARGETGETFREAQQFHST